MFSSISLKKKFFMRNQEILCFLCVLDPGDHSTKSRLASCGQNLHVEKFHFQIISKPFDRSTSYLVWCRALLYLSPGRQWRAKVVIWRVKIACSLASLASDIIDRCIPIFPTLLVHSLTRENHNLGDWNINICQWIFVHSGLVGPY